MTYLVDIMHLFNANIEPKYVVTIKFEYELNSLIRYINYTSNE